jgi:hypothetical protein
MGSLLHYMRTQIDIKDFNPEALIRSINSNTATDYNEQLERQYEDLNSIDRYVVDNFEKFVLGVPLHLISINNTSSKGKEVKYSQNGISKKLNALCDIERMRKKKYTELFPHAEHIEQEQIRVYKLKQQEQIPDLYNIINYRKHQKEIDNLKIEPEREEAPKNEPKAVTTEASESEGETIITFDE